MCVCVCGSGRNFASSLSWPCENCKLKKKFCFALFNKRKLADEEKKKRTPEGNEN